jgi:UDP-3-O-[3-hydroxymyristoyl] glucosamine N-acyltransferase
MKINKLTENLKLLEAEDLASVDPKVDSVEDLADAINDTITELSDGERELSDEKAAEVAKITKDIALQVDASNIAFVIDDNDYNDTKIENFLYKTLDRAYRTAKRTFKEGGKNGANVLIEGLPGAGKTAIVES